MGSEPAGSNPEPLDDVTIALTDTERESARRTFADRAAGRRTGHLDDEDLLTEAELAASALPDRLLRALRRFRRNSNAAGAMLVRNLPTDTTIPPTPVDGYLPNWGELPVATYAQLAVASTVGDVIAYADEKAGNLVQDIVPVRGAADRQENTGTVYLELHTENGFHPHKPDFITLLCLRPDHERTVQTIVGAVARVLPHLSWDAIAVLRTPLFRIQVSSSFGDNGAVGARLVTDPMPVLSGPTAAPELVADFHAMEPLTDQARDALAELKAALLATLRGAPLDVGDLLVIDNRTTIHGRAPFAARFDGTDRWLRRCFAVSDLRRSRGVRGPDSRVCDPLATIGVATASTGGAPTIRIEEPAWTSS
jgi:L-asparagine oxygenase